MKEEKEIKKSSAKKGSTKTSGNAKKQSSNKNTAIKKEAPTKSTTSKTKKTPSKTSTKTSVTKESTSVKKNTNKKTASNSINKTKVAAKTSKPKNNNIKNDKKEVLEVKANIKDEIKNEEVKKEEANIIKENKDTTTSKIKGYELFIIAGSLALLIALVLMVNSNNTKAHCKKAICNESGTICYTYRLDKEGNTKKTWEGRCPKK